jgi:hypothetical protein
LSAMNFVLMAFLTNVPPSIRRFSLIPQINRPRPMSRISRSQPRVQLMIFAPSVRVIMPTLLLVVACGVALVFGITHMRREQSAEFRAITAVQSFHLIRLASKFRTWRVWPSHKPKRPRLWVALPSRRVHRTSAASPRLTLPGLNQPVRRSSLAGQRQARPWNCC